MEYSWGESWEAPRYQNHTPLKKDLLVDLIPVYKKEGITVPEKIEGLAFDGHDLWVVNDDDGGQTETTLLKVNSTYFAK